MMTNVINAARLVIKKIPHLENNVSHIAIRRMKEND